MFEVYMEGHGVDPQQRTRMIMALMAALAVTVSAGSASWAAGRLSIGTVGAPRGQDVLQLSMAPDLPQTRHDPPPPPEKKASDETAVVARGKTTTQPRRKAASDEVPTEVPTEVTPRTRGVASEGTEDGDSGLVSLRNQAGCLGVGCVPDGPVIKDPIIRRQGRGKPPAAAKAREALSVMKARSVYTPDPAQAALAKTKTGLGSRGSGVVKVDFCVGPNGKVISSRVTKRFGGDAEVDQVCKAAVNKWRFKPALVGGKARTTCSEVTFNIQFDG